MKKMSLLNLILLLVVTFAPICVGQATLKVQIKDGKIVSAEKVERDITKKIDYQKNEVANPQMNSVKMQSVNAAPIANATNSNSLLDINLYVFDVNVSDPVGPLISFTIRILSSDNAYVGVAAYLSTDNIITTSDILLTRWQQAQVARDVVTDFSRQDFNIGAAPDGDYYFGAIVDPDNLIVETNESDNTRSSTYADVQKRSEDYDLVIRNINLTDYSLPTLAYSFEVANLGSAGVLATGAVPIKGYLSTDTQITTNDFLIQLALNTQPLGPNQSNTISYQSSVEYLADGYYYLGIIADPSNTIIETNEENNAAYLAEPKVEQNMNAFDITVSSVSIQSVTDDKIYFQCTVTNLGSRGILPLNSFRITGVMSVDQNYTFSDFVVGGWQNSMALGPGEGFTITNWANTSAIQDGDYYFGIVADPENVITETNENNNHMLVSNPMVQIRHAPAPNYELNAVSLSVFDFVSPKITVDYRIRNNGTLGTLPANAFSTSFYLSTDENITTSDSQIYYPIRNAETFPPGVERLTTTSLEISPLVTDGYYYLGLIVDSGSEVADNNRTNNTISAGTSTVCLLSGSFDLVIENLNIISNAGSRITYNYRLHNIGANGAIPERVFIVRTYLSSSPIYNSTSQTINEVIVEPSMRPDDFIDFSPQVTITNVPDGSYYLGVMADALNYIEEINENNNSAFTSNPTVTIGNPTAVDEQYGIPNHFELCQNYPNPFNPSTTISYQIAPLNLPNSPRYAGVAGGETSVHVTLKVYNVLGREVATLVDEYKQAGNYEAKFNTSHFERSREMSSGVYFYTLKAGNYSQTNKMILAK